MSINPIAKLEIRPNKEELEKRKKEICEFVEKLRDWGYQFEIIKTKTEIIEHYGSGNVGI